MPDSHTPLPTPAPVPVPRPAAPRPAVPPGKPRKPYKAPSTGCFAWVLSLGLLIWLVNYAWEHPDAIKKILLPPSQLAPRPTPTPRPVVKLPTPAPTPEEDANAPEAATPTPLPTPEPRASATPPPATPEPTPTPVPAPDLAKLSATPNLWPKQVTLLKPTALPIVINGQVAGQTQANAGVVVSLVRVIAPANAAAAPQVEIELHSSRAVIPAENTDLLARAAKVQEQQLLLAEARAKLAAQQAAARQSAEGAADEGATTAGSATTSAAPATSGNAPGGPTEAAGKGVDVPIGLAPTTGTVLDELNGQLKADVTVRQESFAPIDQKGDAVSLTLKLSNSAAGQPLTGVTGNIYIVAVDKGSRDNRRVVAAVAFPLELQPGAKLEQVVEKIGPDIFVHDRNPLYHDYKYLGWLVRIVKTGDQNDALFEKASDPKILAGRYEIMDTPVGKDYKSR